MTPDNSGDLRLSIRICHGDLAAWHEFVLRYSALIRSMVRRYYYGCSEDDQLNLYVAILQRLRDRELRSYDGRAALSTWVMTVTRSGCFDALRHELGRRRPPKWLFDLSLLEQEVYRLHFLELAPLPSMLPVLQRRGYAIELPALEHVVNTLAERQDRRSRRRMAYELQARSVGARSGRLLEFLDELRLDLEERANSGRPDQALFDEHSRRLAEIETCLHRLDEVERRAIELRFYESRTAPDIARSMNLTGARQAYGLIERALSHLRRMLTANLEPPRSRDANPRYEAP